MHSNRDIRVSNADESREMVISALENKPGTAREIVALNSGAGLYVCGRADSIETGIAMAREVIESGAARAKIDEYVQFTQQLAA
jgi:anthranilate phosphoribosyltransferase